MAMHDSSLLSFRPCCREGYYEDGLEREIIKLARAPNNYQATIYISALEVK